jgi:hypothetical protein
MRPNPAISATGPVGGGDTRRETRLLRLLAVVALVLTGSQLLTAPSGAAQHAEPVVLAPSATSVTYAKQLALTATVAAPQPDAQVDFYAKPVGVAAKLLGSAAAVATAMRR